VRRYPVIPLAGAVMAVTILASCGTGAGRAGSSAASKLSTRTPNALSTITGAPSSTVPGFPPEQATGAVEITLTASDLTTIGDLYANETGFTACAVSPVPGQFYEALISATGLKWAFGTMQPAPGCTVISNGEPVSPYGTWPFGNIAARKALFMQQPGGPWTFNSVGSNPFPCPADLNIPGRTPGPGTPYVPLAVLNAVGVRWSTSPNCSKDVYVPTPTGAP
jgi:hypothetical protein